MDANEILRIILQTVWLFIPAYLPSSIAVLVGGGLPLDFYKNFPDGRRILGDGKTWRGFCGGILGGTIAGLCQNAVAVKLGNEFLVPFHKDWFMAACIVLSLAAGSMCGDATGSFIKRRLNIERGKEILVIDKLLFVFFAWLFLLVFFPSRFADFFWTNRRWIAIPTLLLITPLLHKLANVIGYKIGKKSVPW